jgi:nitroreductase/dihydropteridine reductase
MNDIIERLEWRYAVKKFDTERRLPDAEVELLKKAFNLTATSYGLQPIKMAVVSNKALQHELLQYSHNQPQVAQASHLLVLCIETEIDSRYIHDYFDRIRQVRGTSEEILTPYREGLIREFSDRENFEVAGWARNQAYLALGNLLTICALRGIDSCPMEGFDPVGYDALLKLGVQGLASVLVLPVGYRAEDDRFSGFKKVRRPLEKSIIEIN